MNILRIVPYFKHDSLDIYQKSGFSQTILELNKNQCENNDTVFLLSNYRISYKAGNLEIINPLKYLKYTLTTILSVFRLAFKTEYFRFSFLTFHKDFSKLLYASALGHIIEKKKIDVIHVHSLDQNVLLYLSYLNINKVKFILTLHFNYSKGNYFIKKEGFKYIINKNLCLITVISSKLKERLQEITDLKIKLIPNGIENDDLYFKYNDSEFERFTKDKKFKYLLFTGSLTERKNPEFMINVLKFLPSNYRLIICGDGPLQDQISNKVSILNLSKRVLLLGYVPHKYMNDIFKRSDLLCVVSTSEAFGRMVIESNSVGTPVFLFSDLEPAKDFSNLSGVKILIRESTQDYATAIRNFDLDNLNTVKIIKDIEPFYWNNITKQYKSVYKEHFDF